jgi:hypothetical protein
MKFAKIVFIAAGVWGIIVLSPLYFLVDITGRQYPPPATYAQFFYGFFSLGMAWQFAFLIIGSNPMRFRPLIIPSIFEKFSFVVTVIVLYSRARIPLAEATAAVPDLLLGILFSVALAKTRASDRQRAWASPPNLA